MTSSIKVINYNDLAGVDSYRMQYGEIMTYTSTYESDWCVIPDKTQFNLFLVPFYFLMLFWLQRSQSHSFLSYTLDALHYRPFFSLLRWLIMTHTYDS